jgi:hypothetical protein
MDAGNMAVMLTKVLHIYNAGLPLLLAKFASAKKNWGHDLFPCIIYLE